MKITNKTALIAFKLFVTVGFFYWLLTLANFETVWITLSTVSMAVVAFAIGMTLFTFLVSSLHWSILLRRSAKHVSYTNILPSYYLGVFFNNILPTTMGGDVVRAIHLGLHGISMKSLIGSTFIDRGVGLFVILGMGIVSLSLSQEITLGTRNSILLATVAFTTLLCLWLLFNTGFLKRI